jgi:hypothetical protein
MSSSILAAWGYSKISFIEENHELNQIPIIGSLFSGVTSLGNTISYMKVTHVVLSILGYIPGISVISGTIRIVAAVAILILPETSLMNEFPYSLYIPIIFLSGSNITTGLIVRGVFEAFFPVGKIINASLDIINTFR